MNHKRATHSVKEEWECDTGTMRVPDSGLVIYATDVLQMTGYSGCSIIHRQQTVPELHARKEALQLPRHAARLVGAVRFRPIGPRVERAPKAGRHEERLQQRVQVARGACFGVRVMVQRAFMYMRRYGTFAI